MPERINLGQGVVVAGGALLFASLFIDWYEPPVGESMSAWTAFELVDILLAGLALVAVGSALPIGGSVGAALPPGRWLPWLGLGAFALVVLTLLNEPPGARGTGLEIGAWIGLAGATLLAIGGLLTTARISVVIGPRTSGEGEETATRPVDEAATRPVDEAATRPVHGDQTE